MNININTIKDMVYSNSAEAEVLSSGKYKSIPFMIINNCGMNPSAYIQVHVKENYGIDYDKYNCYCHGGLTFASFETKFHPHTNGKVWLGWDYAHFGDFLPLFGKGKKWTTIEILNEVIEVIDNYITDNKEEIVEEKEHSLKDDVKFISYNGRFPNLCSGELILEINNKEYKFGRTYDSDYKDNLEGFWMTGGCLGEDYEPILAPWRLSWNDKDYPEEIRKYKDILIEIFNENVPHGCCGGCS